MQDWQTCCQSLRISWYNAAYPTVLIMLSPFSGASPYRGFCNLHYNGAAAFMGHTTNILRTMKLTAIAIQSAASHWITMMEIGIEDPSLFVLISVLC
jgi:hypothetical protein